MPIKNSFSVLLCNFKLVGKIFFFILIVILIASAVLMSILSPVLKGYFEKMQEETPVSPEEFIKHPILSLQKFLNYFTDFLKQNSELVMTRLVYIGLLVILSRFLLMLPFFPVSKILHDKMTSGFDVGLTNAFTSTLAQNLLFNLVTSILFGLVDFLIFIGSVYMVKGLFELIGVLSLPLSLLIVLAVYSLRMTLFGQWLPAYLTEKPKNVFLAFPSGMRLSVKQFSKNFICTFVVLIIFVTLIASTFVPTLGLLPILLIPTFIVAYSALCLILNYTYTHQKYFTDNGVTIYNPTKKY